MLAIQKQPKYFSKVVTLPNGSQALLFFELIERNGHLIAKAIRAEAINASSIPEQKICALPGIVSPAEYLPVKYFTPEFITSFLKDFSFVTSQPTRAPSFC